MGIEVNRMKSKSKYAFLMKNTVVWFIIILFIGAVTRILGIYHEYATDIIDAIVILLRVIKAILIIGLIGMILYLVIQSVAYFQSKFYRIYRVNIFEALYHGVLDIHVVYDRVSRLDKVTDINMEIQRQVVTFRVNGKNYCVLYQDLYGKINGKESSDYWTLLGRKTKKYGRTNNRILGRVANPIVQCKRYAQELSDKTGLVYEPYVVLSGFYKIDFSSERIIMAFEISSFAH